MKTTSGVRAALLAGLGLLAGGAGGALAQTSPVAQPPSAPSPASSEDQAEADTEVGEIVVTGEYEGRPDSPRFTQPLLDTPQTIVVLPDQLLQEQGRRTLRDSLRNITGLSLQSGEGNPPGGGDTLKIRGFNVRDDILVDGVPDVGVYFRDPFNAEQIEVLKGPSAAFAGRGSTGGSINIISRGALLEEFTEGEIGVGTDSLFRITADASRILNAKEGVAVRVNAMYHRSDEPGRDQVQQERWGLAPSIGFGLNGPTQLRLDWFHIQQNDVPDYGVPNIRLLSFVGSGFEGRPAPVRRSNFYGYSSDYRELTADRLTARLDHEFSPDLRVRSTLRWGRTHSDIVVSAPIFPGDLLSPPGSGPATTVNAATQVFGFAKPRDQVDQIWINQTDFSLRSRRGELLNNLVVGFEVSREQAHNRRRIDRTGPALNLLNPVVTSAPDIPYQGTRARLTTDAAALYLFDSVELGRFEANGGVRLDRVRTRVQGLDDTGLFPGFLQDLTRTDTEPSFNLGLVYKPTPASSIYLAFATAFEPSGRAEVVQLAGRGNGPPVAPAAFDVGPERSESVELGARWQVLDRRLTLSGALFQTTKTNARTPGLNPGDPPIVLDGEQRIRGVELSVQGSLTPEWNVFAGYTYLDGRFVRTNFAPDRNRRLDGVPEHSFSAWTSYEITDAFKAGGGVQYVSDRVSEIPNANFLPITVPAFTVIDLFAEYRVSDAVAVRLNVYNVADEEYLGSLTNNQSIPGPARSAVVTLTAAF